MWSVILLAVLGGASRKYFPGIPTAKESYCGKNNPEIQVDFQRSVSGGHRPCSSPARIHLENPFRRVASKVGTD